MDGARAPVHCRTDFSQFVEMRLPTMGDPFGILDRWTDGFDLRGVLGPNCDLHKLCEMHIPTGNIEFDAPSCNNPLCTYCRGSGKPYECGGYKHGRYDNRSLRDLAEQKKPSIGFRCQFKKHFRSLIPGRNFMFLMGLLDLPWEYATEQFYRSFPSLRDDEYFSKGPHEFAWCIICIVNTLFRKK